MGDMNLAVIAIVGATATGKSDLALDLAERLDGEVINADSMQFYRGMDIGTAKLSVGDRRGIPHHQLDVLDVTQEASVARFQSEARADVTAIHGRGRRAIIVGGSGLYVRALLDRFEFPETDPEVRAALAKRAEAEGPGILHRELAVVDPEAASRIEPQNAKRIVRALEVIALTGRPYSASLPVREYACPAVQLGLRMDYVALDARIGQRTERMWSAGLVDETVRLVHVGLREGLTARRAVGYAEALAHIDGDLSGVDAMQLAAQRTRRLARKQAQWFAPDPRVEWITAAGDSGDRARLLDDAWLALARLGTLKP